MKENNTELEAILVQNQKNFDETNGLLEILIAQNEKNNPEAILEANLMVAKEISDSLKGVSKIVGEKGEKGNDGKDGYTPIKGKDYFTREEIETFKQEITPIKGKDYFTREEIETFKQEITPIKGKDYFDGKDGKDIDEEKIISKLISKLPKNNLEKKLGERLDKVKKEIEAKIPDFKPSAQSIPVKVNGVEVAGKLESINITGTGLAVSADSWGNININASMPVSVDLSSQCDGVNKIFTLPSFTTILMLSGSSFPFIYKPVTDFTAISSTQIELTSEVIAPESGQTLIALVI